MIKEYLLAEKEELKLIKEKAKRNLLYAPDGYLRIIKNKGRMECYYKDKDGPPGVNGRYMKKSEYILACQIAQRDYDNIILEDVEKRIRAIDVFLKQYEETDLSKAYEQTGKLRQTIIKPWKLPDMEYAKWWQSVKYEGKTFGGEASFFNTEKGEKVRSKSEKIIADKLYSMQIPYRYEYPVTLEGYGTVYPDFCILNVRTRREYYLEHLGMMDNPEYAEKAITKINAYIKNKIYIGDKLLLTFETRHQPLNFKMMEGLFREKFM